MTRQHRATLPLATLAAACVLGGCSLGPGKAPDHAPAPATGCAFAPVGLRIHPLTHVDASAPGVPPDKCLLVLHLELRDRFGDTVKGVGRLHVELLKPGAGMAPGIETQAMTWEVAAFADPEPNSRRFDPSTRTYRLPLLADPWVAAWLAREHGSSEPAWLKVRAALLTAEGGDHPLADEFIIQK